MKFYNYFSPWILERGMDYYHNDLVKEIDVNENTISALVEGTEPYKVNIVLDTDKIIELNCTCPYGESGKNCKHMAAVLFKWESEFMETAYTTPSIYSLKKVQKEDAKIIYGLDAHSPEDLEKNYRLMQIIMDRDIRTLSRAQLLKDVKSIEG